MLKNSSELIEAAGLIGKLFDFDQDESETPIDSVVLSGSMQDFSDYSVDNLINKNLRESQDLTPKAEVVKPKPKVLKTPEVKDLPPVTNSEFTGDKLDNVLARMSVRGGFSTAAIISSEGFVVAEYNNNYGEFVLVALSSILGNTIEKASDISRFESINTVAIDISFTDKLVLRRFFVKESEFYLVVICPQDIDERDEMEVSFIEINSLLQ